MTTDTIDTQTTIGASIEIWIQNPAVASNSAKFNMIGGFDDNTTDEFIHFSGTGRFKNLGSIASFQLIGTGGALFEQGTISVYEEEQT